MFLQLLNPFHFYRFSAFGASQCLTKIDVPAHILVLCGFKGQLVVYLTLEVVCFGYELALVLVGAGASAPPVRCVTSEFGSDKRL